MLAAAVAACATIDPPYAIRTPNTEPQACMEALMVGSLERHAQTGLGIGTAEGVTPVEWPFGYSSRLEAASIVLLNRAGTVVAHEHDRVQVGGGLGPTDLWFACGDVTVESSVGG
jgi:hypothetical protein